MTAAIVTNRHYDYTYNAPDWMLCRDVLAGQRAIKAKTTTYLPALTASMKDERGNLSPEYKLYLERASFVNYATRTVNALTGMAFRKDIKMNPAAWGDLEYLATDVDGTGLNINLQAKRVLSNVLGIGRELLFVDYPRTERRLTRAQEQAQNIRATIQRRAAEDVLDWHTIVRGGEIVLDYLVMREEKDRDPRDVSSNDNAKQYEYRVLQLVENVYTVSMFDDGGGLIATYEPLASGSTLDYIPAVFVNVHDNTVEVDESPILDICNTNIKHYQVSADQANAMHYHAHPQPYVSGVTDQFMQKHGGKMAFGSKVLLMFPEGAKFDVVQVSFNDSAYTGELERLRQAIIDQGAKLIESDKAGVEAADTVRLRQSAENSVLGSIAQNISEAYKLCLQWAGTYMDVTLAEDFEFELNQNFYPLPVDGPTLATVQTSVDRGYLAVVDYHSVLKNADLLAEDRTTEEVLRDAENNPDILPPTTGFGSGAEGDADGNNGNGDA